MIRSRSCVILLAHVRLLPQQVGEGQHAGERIIDFVGHAGRQAADRGQFFRPADLLPGGLRELRFPAGNGLGHGIDGLAQEPQLARRADADPRRHVAGITFRDMATIRPTGRITSIVTA